MLSSTPFKIHDENLIGSVTLKSIKSKSQNEKKNVLFAIDQSNISSFIDKTPIKPSSKSTQSLSKSTRKALGDLSNSQVNSRLLNTPSNKDTSRSIEITLDKKSLSKSNLSKSTKTVRIFEDSSHETNIRTDSHQNASSDLNFSIGDMICSRRERLTDPYDVMLKMQTDPDMTCDIYNSTPSINIPTAIDDSSEHVHLPIYLDTTLDVDLNETTRQLSNIPAIFAEDIPFEI